MVTATVRAAIVNHIHAPDLGADPTDNTQYMGLDLVAGDDDGNLRRVIKLCSCHNIHRFLARVSLIGCLVEVHPSSSISNPVISAGGSRWRWEPPRTAACGTGC